MPSDTITSDAPAPTQGLLTINKFITIPGSSGKNMVLLPKLGDGAPEPDSDNPDGDTPLNIMSQAQLPKRSSRFFSET